MERTNICSYERTCEQIRSFQSYWCHVSLLRSSKFLIPPSLFKYSGTGAGPLSTKNAESLFEAPFTLEDATAQDFLGILSETEFLKE